MAKPVKAGGVKMNWREIDATRERRHRLTLFLSREERQHLVRVEEAESQHSGLPANASRALRWLIEREHARLTETHEASCDMGEDCTCEASSTEGRSSHRPPPKS